MTKEDAEFRRYLEENGFDTSQMGLNDDDSIGSTTILETGDEKTSIDKQGV